MSVAQIGDCAYAHLKTHTLKNHKVVFFSCAGSYLFYSFVWCGHLFSSDKCSNCYRENYQVFFLKHVFS